MYLLSLAFPKWGGGGGQVEKLVWRTGIRDVPLSCMFLGLSQVGNK